MNKVSTQVQASIEDAPASGAPSSTPRRRPRRRGARTTPTITSFVDAPAIVGRRLRADKATGVCVGLSISRNDIRTAMEAYIKNVAVGEGDGRQAHRERDRGRDDRRHLDRLGDHASPSASRAALAFSGGGATAVNQIRGTANAHDRRGTLTATGTAAATGTIAITTIDTARRSTRP